MVVLVLVVVPVVGDVLELGLICAEHKPAMPINNAARVKIFSFFVVVMLSSFSLGLLP